MIEPKASDDGAQRIAEIEAREKAATPSPAMRVVNEQAEDGGLWFVPQTITEDILQKALRRLHEAVEGKSSEECAKAALRASEPGYGDREELLRTAKIAWQECWQIEDFVDALIRYGWHKEATPSPAGNGARTWRTDDDGLTWADGDILFNDAWALTDEHNATVAELRAALAARDEALAQTVRSVEAINVQLRRAEAAETALTAAREALQKYGRHLDGCRAGRLNWHHGDRGFNEYVMPCTCGLAHD